MRQLLRDMCKAFFLVATGVLIAVAIGATFLVDATVMFVMELWRILFIALLSGLSGLVFYSPKEISARGMLVRYAIHFILIFSIIFYFVSHWQWLNIGTPSHFAILLISLFVIYFGTMLIIFWRDKKTADNLNEKLVEYKKHHRDDAE